MFFWCKIANLFIVKYLVGVNICAFSCLVTESRRPGISMWIGGFCQDNWVELNIKGMLGFIVNPRELANIQNISWKSSQKIKNKIFVYLENISIKTLKIYFFVIGFQSVKKSVKYAIFPRTFHFSTPPLSSAAVFLPVTVIDPPVCFPFPAVALT